MRVPAVTWTGNESCSLLLRVAHLFSSFVVNTELLRYRLQRGIELHERMFDSSMGVMAGITAIALGHGLGGLAIRVKAIVGPLIRVAARILDFDRQTHQVRLKMTRLVDRAFALRIPFIDHKGGLIRPLATVEKLLVGPALYEDVSEHLVAAWTGAIVHAVPGGKKHPVAVAGGAEEVALGIVLRLGRFFFRRCRQKCEAESEDQRSGESEFHDSLQQAFKMA